MGAEPLRVGGPRVVALGGGHGLAATLSATRRYAGDLCAIVSVADDGGSSGRLRAAFGLPAPGDLRRCLVALADPDSIWTTAFEHRFAAGELAGHAFGNLVIAGLTQVLGDFSAALEEAGRLVGAVGKVLPATREGVVLKALVRVPGGGEEGLSVEGEVAVSHSGGIVGVSLTPDDPAPPQAALDALDAADQVVIGPGSLYTSVLAVVAVPAIRRALQETSARKVYVCNLRAQDAETAGLDVAGHVRALAAHGLRPDVVLCQPGALPMGEPTVECIERQVAKPGAGVHDPVRLAAALADLVG